MNRKEKRDYFILYSIAFLAMIALMFSGQLMDGTTLVKTGDSSLQHIPAFAYYGEYLREILRTLFAEHRLVFPEWDFSIGYGSNILTTLHYYAIGDPLALMSVFVSGRGVIYMYGFLIVLRYYLAGASFSGFCIFMGKKSKMALLAGAFTYLFSFYAMNMGVYHPFFLNPMIYLPLVLTGAEKLFRNKKPYLLIGAVFLSAVSNFYFFYMIVLLTVIYVLVRCCFVFGWRRRREALVFILRVGFYSLVGVLLGAVVLFPVILAFLNDYRSEVSYHVPLFYTKKYYMRLPAAFTGIVEPDGRTMLSYGPAAFAAVVLLFADRKKNRERAQEKVLFCIGTLFLLLPFAGYVFNGMAYVTNRWSWGYAMLVSFILATVWEDFFCAQKSKAAVLAVLSAGYLIWCRQHANMKYVLILLAAAVLLTAFCAVFKKRRVRVAAKFCMLAVLAAGALVNRHVLYYGKDTHLQRLFYTEDEVTAQWNQNSDRTVRSLTEEGENFFRYTGDVLGKNTSMNHGTHSVQFFWSLSNGNVEKYRVELQIPTTSLYDYAGLDGRTALGTLAGCRYYLSSDEGSKIIPYGHTLVDTRDGYEIYENDYTLPLGYTYDSYMTRGSFDRLNGAQREEAMLESVLLEEEAAGYTQSEPECSGSELEYKIVPGDGVRIEENAFVVSEKGAQVTIEIEGKGAGEYYLGFTGYACQGSFEGATLTAAFAGSSRKNSGFYYRTENSPWATVMHDIMLNIGYTEEAQNKITLSFSKKGRYIYDSMFLWYQPMDGYADKIAARQADAWEDEVIGTDCVSGTVNLKEDKLLCLTIPYDSGWTAYVDGEKQEVLQGNVMFSVLKLTAGEHKIELFYRTPGLRAGLLSSLLGVLCLAGIVLSGRRKKTGTEG